MTQAPPVPRHIAVVGSGPAGMVLALELARLGCQVTLVESGDAQPGAAQALSQAELAQPATHVPMDDAVARRFGGTSHLWGGRCVPFDPLDFVPRPGLRDAHWPFDAATLAPYAAQACAYADCGDASFDYAQAVQPQRPLVAGFTDAAVQSRHLERWSAWPPLVVRLGPQIRQHPRIDCLLGHTLVDVETDARRERVTALLLRPSGGDTLAAPRRIAADACVLACGGVETTRLLLNLQQAGRLALAGQAHLGRYYMGHISGKIANVQFRGDAARTVSGFERSGRHFVRRRFTFSDEALQAYGLLNVALWLDNPPPADPAHRSGILSAAYLALRTPLLRDRLAAPAIRKALLAGTAAPGLGPHLVNLLRAPFGTAAFVLRFLHGRYRARPRLPGFFVHSPGNRYALHYHAEQLPNADSCITLTDSRDRLGLRRARIDLRYSRQDAQSVVDAHRLLDTQLQAQGVGQLLYAQPEAERVDAVLAQARDGLHQIGSTRMAASADEGVCDGQGRVFGLANLHVCSSSLFPTSGQANPTFTLMAFAVRQAQHLAQAAP